MPADDHVITRATHQIAFSPFLEKTAAKGSTVRHMSERLALVRVARTFDIRCSKFIERDNEYTAAQNPDLLHRRNFREHLACHLVGGFA